MALGTVTLAKVSRTALDESGVQALVQLAIKEAYIKAKPKGLTWARSTSRFTIFFDWNSMTGQVRDDDPVPTVFIYNFTFTES